MMQFGTFASKLGSMAQNQQMLKETSSNDLGITIIRISNTYKTT